MLVTGKRLAKKLETKTLSLQSENEDIEQVNFQKLLGVTIDEELTFDNHVGGLSKKLGQRLGVLRRIKRFLPLDQRILYYNTMFKQVMMYGATAWANCSVENLKKFFGCKNVLPASFWMQIQEQTAYHCSSG